MKALIVAALGALLIATLAAPFGGGRGLAAPPSPLPLPPGWSRVSGPDGTELRWVSPDPLPFRDARPEFRDGDRVLGYPLQEGSTLVLMLPAAAAAAVREPSAWLGVRRLDGPTPDQHFDVAPPSPGGPPDEAAAPALPAKDDPGRRGPYKTVRYSYDLDPVPFPRYPAPLEVVGDVIAPVGALGPRPLVLFLHGRHAPCYQGSMAGGEWPCPGGWKPIPSHEGYRYVAGLLASQGYVTVSIAANGINGQDFVSPDGGASARSKLIRHHLRLWAKWSDEGGDPWGGVFEGKVALDQVVLIGHSRGGEGVERAAVDSRPTAPYRIVGLVAIGPTTFGRQFGLGIPQAVLLPYCDGDVSDLQGQQIIDGTRDLGEDAALRSSVLIMGTNHNYFNTEWTPGLAKAPAEDDWNYSGSPTDPTCGVTSPMRLKPTAQQAVGATYMAALVQVATQREEAVLPLLDGSGTRADSAGRAIVRTHALGANRQIVLRPKLSTELDADGVLARPCRGSLKSDFGTVSECAVTYGVPRLPHWLPMIFAEGLPSGVAIDVSWRKAGGSVRITLDKPTELTAEHSLEIRVAADPQAGPAQFGIRLVDGNGRVATVPGRVRLAPLPGDVVPLGKVWAYTARFDLAGVGGIDLASVSAFDLVPSSDGGHIWLLDAASWEVGLALFDRQFLPQVSLADLRIRETDGPQQIELPLHVTGELTEPALMWVNFTNYFDARESRSRLVTLEPGKEKYTLPLVVPGDAVYFPLRNFLAVSLKAVSGVTTGRYLGVVRLVEDDRPPKITFTADDTTVAEGGSIVFRVTLSQPAADYMFYEVQLRQFGSRPELYTDDVPAEWLELYIGPLPDPPVPLGSVLLLFIGLAPGMTTTSVELPIAADGIVEGEEGILAVIPAGPVPGVKKDIKVGVTVADAP